MQQTVTVPAKVVVHEVPLWQVATAGGVVLLGLIFLAVIIVMALASFRRNKVNVEE
jgi:hypothetical protein